MYYFKPGQRAKVTYNGEDPEGLVGEEVIIEYVGKDHPQLPGIWAAAVVLANGAPGPNGKRGYAVLCNHLEPVLLDNEKSSWDAVKEATGWRPDGYGKE